MLIISIHTEVFGVMGYPLSFIAVPVFFLMSGFYDCSERNIGQWFPKSLRTLILPAVIWILIATAYGKILGYAKDRSWGENNDINWFKENWELLCDLDKLKAYYMKK